MNTKDNISAFERRLREEERSEGTIEKYRRDILAFLTWLGDRELGKNELIAWKEELVNNGYAPITVNSMLSALNKYVKFIGHADFCVSFLRIQRKLFREQSKELSKSDYEKLLGAASKGKPQIALIIETIGATGIRVSELKYITVEAVRRERADISLKGKIRTILIPGKLCRKLLKYAQKAKIASGEIFLTKGGKSIDRRQVWAEMKRLCHESGVEASKVFPHNLRHMFARVYYRACRDIAQLADVLGHSSIETTRIYLIETGKEYARRLDSLGLVS